MNNGYNNKLIPNVLPTKFIGLPIDSILSWRIHVAKLSTSCYVIKSIKLLMAHKTL
jgi:hypothetical protein